MTDFHSVAKEEYQRLREEWGLEGITLKYQPRFTKTLGQFSPGPYGQRLTIKYANMAHESEDFVRDVIRHEVAHAIEWVLYRRSSHSMMWRQIAKAVGCHPRASASKAQREYAVINSQSG